MTKRKKGFKKNRAWELDALRGLAILLVVWDHIMLDAAVIFRDNWVDAGRTALIKFSDFALSYHESALRFYGWPVFVFLFFIISGICTTFSRNNFKRAIKISIVALLVSLVTYVLDITALKDSGFSVFIKFGVLHCFALCTWFFAIMDFLVNIFSPEKKLKKRAISELSDGFNDEEKKSADYRYKLAKLIEDKKEEPSFKSKMMYFYITKITLWSVVTIITFVLHDKFNIPFIDVLKGYGMPALDTTKITGMFIYTTSWWTADYFPLLPYFCFFMLGATIGVLLYRNKKSLLPMLDGKWHYFLTYPGKYSIFYYLGSQIIAYGLFALITFT